jgi:hypothetical protein
MAENIPNPTPGVPPVPPKKAETGKVQPKKETVRISLPPKPTSAPTIRLPTLPAAGPSPAAAPAAPVAPALTGATPGRMPSLPAPTAAPGTARAAAPTTPPGARPAAPAAPAPAARPAPAPAPAAKGVSGLDIGLAIAAAVVGLGAVVSVFLLMQLK